MKPLVLLMLLYAAFPAPAQEVRQAPDPLIAAMVAQVSAENIEATVRRLAAFGTRHTLSDTLGQQQGIGAARTWIKSELERYARESGGRLQVTYDTFLQPADGKRVPAPTLMKNVLALLPGTDPEDKRIFIVSGHYDSRASDIMNATIAAPGANDDASGTAVVMELARVMSQRKFNCTLLFVAMVGEEQGLYGSEHLAQKAADSGWQVAGMITNDIVGNTCGSETGLKDNKSVRVFSEGVPAKETAEEARLRMSTGNENDGRARQLARYIKATAEQYVDQMEVKLIYRRDRYLRGGDHTPFSQRGFTAVRITEMNEDFNRQHQDIRKEDGVAYGDLPDFVDYAYVQKVARMNLSALASLALAPPAPVDVVMRTAALTNRSTLAWQTPPGEKPAGYFVVMRETTSPYWEKKFFTTDSTLTLDYSKDNYYFGVCAVDKEGHESMVVIPLPVK